MIGLLLCWAMGSASGSRQDAHVDHRSAHASLTWVLLCCLCSPALPTKFVTIEIAWALAQLPGIVLALLPGIVFVLFEP